jgi:hypothetical protein
MSKIFLPIIFLLFSSICFAQTKEQITVLAQTGTLHNTVFGDKDSLTLEGLFWKELSYGHSSGKIENRNEAINSIVHNKSTYTKDYSFLTRYDIWISGATAIVRYLFKATEKKEDGSESPLYLNIMLVWTKEKGKWWLMGRQAIKMQS